MAGFLRLAQVPTSGWRETRDSDSSAAMPLSQPGTPDVPAAVIGCPTFEDHLHLVEVLIGSYW